MKKKKRVIVIGESLCIIPLYMIHKYDRVCVWCKRNKPLLLSVGRAVLMRLPQVWNVICKNYFRSKGGNMTAIKIRIFIINIFFFNCPCATNGSTGPRQKLLSVISLTLLKLVPKTLFFTSYTLEQPYFIGTAVFHPPFPNLIFP